jgi:hypothetical protein
LSPLRKFSLGAAICATLIVGVLPVHDILHDNTARLLWITALAACPAAAMLLRARLRSQDLKAKRYILLLIAMALWLVAPLTTPAGVFLFRLPMLQIALLTWIHRARLNRIAKQFPAVIDTLLTQA